MELQTTTGEQPQDKKEKEHELREPSKQNQQDETTGEQEGENVKRDDNNEGEKEREKQAGGHDELGTIKRTASDSVLERKESKGSARGAGIGLGSGHLHLHLKLPKDKDPTPSEKSLIRRLSARRLTKKSRAPSIVLGMSTRPPRAGSVFQQFVVVGYPSGQPVKLHPLAERPRAEVLFSFPEDLGPLDGIADFCFPTGVEATVVNSDSSTGLIHDLDDSSHSHTFVINAGTGLMLYGACVVQTEMLRSTPSFFNKPAYEVPAQQQAATPDLLSPPTASSRPGHARRNSVAGDGSQEARNKIDHVSFNKTDLNNNSEPREPTAKRGVRRPLYHNIAAPRAYCFISRFPFFKLHFEVIYHFLATERAERNKAHSTETEPDKVMSASQTIVLRNSKEKEKDDASSSLTKTAASGIDGQPPSTYNLNSEAMKLLFGYHGTRVSPNEVIFELPGCLTKRTFICPGQSDDELLTEWSMASLLRLLSLRTIITLITNMMLETRIVVMCKSLGVLSCVVLSILPLLRPYVWQGTFIPLLPDNLEEFVQSPVPYIIGVPGLCEHSLMAIRGDVLILDVDTDTVILPSYDVPRLPHEDVLWKAVKPFYDFLHPFEALSIDSKLLSPRKLNSPNRTRRASSVSVELTQSSPETKRKALTPESPSNSHTIIHDKGTKSPPPKSPETPARKKGGWWSNFQSSKSEKASKHRSWDKKQLQVIAEQAEVERKKEAEREEKEKEEREKREREENERKEREREREEKIRRERERSMSVAKSAGNVSQPTTTINSARKGSHRRAKSWWWGDKEEAEKQEEKEREAHMKQELENQRKKSIHPEHLLRPWRASENELQAVVSFLREVRRFQDSLIEDIETNVLAMVLEDEGVTLQGFFEGEDNIQKLIFCFPKTEREFYEDFLMTQHFTVFSEKLLERIEGKQKDAVLKKIRELETLIEEEEKQKASAISVLKIYQEGNAMVDIPVQLKEELEMTVQLADEKIAALKNRLRKLTRFNHVLF